MYGFGDHVVEEIERVEAAGGWITDGRVCNVLAVSRAFGDPEFKVRKPSTWADIITHCSCKEHLSVLATAVLVGACRARYLHPGGLVTGTFKSSLLPQHAIHSPITPRELCI